MALDGRTRQEQVHLIVIVAKTTQILNHTQASLFIGQRGIEIVLFALIIDRKALEGEISTGTKGRLDRARHVHGRLHIQAALGHAVLDDVELKSNDASHFDCATEGYLAVALGEVEISHAEFGPWYVHGKVDFGAAREVFDVTVSSVFGAALSSY